MYKNMYFTVPKSDKQLFQNQTKTSYLRGYKNAQRESGKTRMMHWESVHKFAQQVNQNPIQTHKLLECFVNDTQKRVAVRKSLE